MELQPNNAEEVAIGNETGRLKGKTLWTCK